MPPTFYDRGHNKKMCFRRVKNLLHGDFLDIVKKVIFRQSATIIKLFYPDQVKPAKCRIDPKANFTEKQRENVRTIYGWILSSFFLRRYCSFLISVSSPLLFETIEVKVLLQSSIK
jgi:hypothetical protein